MVMRVVALVEREATRQRLRRSSLPPAPRKEAPFVPPDVITLSNAFGSGGLSVAAAVGARMDIPVYGRQIVEHIATTRTVKA
jgi:hypothetical protein